MTKNIALDHNHQLMKYLETLQKQEVYKESYNATISGNELEKLLLLKMTQCVHNIDPKEKNAADKIVVLSQIYASLNKLRQVTIV